MNTDQVWILQKPKILVLRKPYTIEQIREHQDENGYVKGNVAVPLSSIIDCDFESFLDLLAVKLVDNECLMDINYKAVGIDDVDSGDANIIIEVSGDVSQILTDEEDEYSTDKEEE